MVLFHDVPERIYCPGSGVSFTRLLCRGQKQDRWPERGEDDECLEEEAKLTYMCYQAAV